MKTPIDMIEMVQVATQTDVVRNISCGTSGGVMVTIENIEVVNMLQRSHVETTVKDYGVGYDKIWILVLSGGRRFAKFRKVSQNVTNFNPMHNASQLFTTFHNYVHTPLRSFLIEYTVR